MIDFNSHELRFSTSRGVAVLNAKVYTTGGLLVDFRTTNEVYAFSPHDNNVSLVTPMNYHRCVHGCCSHAGSLFVCGGKHGLASNCCEKFNNHDKEWEFVAEMKEAREEFQIVSCGKFIWAIGGDSLDGILRSTEYYDEVIDKWTLSTPMLEKRCDHSAVAFRDKIYVLGGYNWEVGRLRTAEVLDTKTKQFSFIKPMKTRRCRFAAAISDHKLYCFGGIGRFHQLESFNLYSEKWKKENTVDNFTVDISAVTLYD